MSWNQRKASQSIERSLTEQEMFEFLGEEILDFPCRYRKSLHREDTTCRKASGCERQLNI